MPPIKHSNRTAMASKLGMAEKRLQQKKKNSSPRSPLKVIRDLNALSSRSSSSSSSSATNVSSISSDAQRGCLRFFLSHHQSSSSNAAKNSCNKPKSVVPKTPKSAPNVKNSRRKLIDRNSSMKMFGNAQTLEKSTCRRVDKLRKKPPPSSRSGINGKFSSGLELKLGDNAGTFTPVARLTTEYGLENFGERSKGLKMGEEEEEEEEEEDSPIPPIQASVSPEVQGGGSISMVAATPTTCYAAGHVLSGVSDNRKCRSRGILTIGDNDLFGSCKNKISENGDEKFTMLVNVNNHRLSLVPSPIEASMQWVLSPCNEENIARNDLGFDQSEVSMPFGCSSSPGSSLGFSSELFNVSNSTITTSDGTSTTRSSRSMSCVLSPESAIRIRGLFGPSFDHLVCKVENSLEQGKNLYNHNGETTPSFEDSIGSGNVMRTPISDSSPPNFGLFDESTDDISRLWFERELDSIDEALQGASLSPLITKAGSSNTSFEFNPLLEYTGSIDLALPMKDIDKRISSIDGLVNHISEIEESDCCRCFSDEDDSNNFVDPFGSCYSPKLDTIDDSSKIFTYGRDPNKTDQHKESIQRNDEGSPLEHPKSQEKSLEVKNSG